jgi:hypothetical protein
VCDIGKDYESEKIVISQQAKAILKEMTQQIEWIDAKGSTGHDFSVMKVIRILQDPIIIPSPSFMGMNETPHGTYAIRSDGRDVISTKNINIIKEVGIALSLNAKVNQKVLRWRPRLIISGAAYYALASAGIKCLLEPISPLIPENHPLSQPNENEYSSRNL